MRAAQTIRRVAVVLFDSFPVLDVYGPLQAFASCQVEKGDGTWQPLFELFGIAECAGVVKPGEGPPSYVEYDFTDAPGYDILLIPGGPATHTAVNNEAFLKHLAEVPARHDHHDSVHRISPASAHQIIRRPARHLEQDCLVLDGTAGTTSGVGAPGALGR